jgi:methionyl aminopeptidase
VSLKKLDQLAESLIKKAGGKPSFKMVKSYHWTTCINVNQGVVHGVPGDYRLKAGDLVSVDIGIFYQGFHTDMARTIRLGSKNQRDKDDFLVPGRRALKKAIKAAKPGNRVGHISAVIEKEIRRGGLSPVRNLTGHGVGRELHEEPRIHCFLKGKIEETPKLKPGMVLAIEVIYVQGKPDLVLKDDSWTIETADGQLAGLFENTIAVTKKKPLILTRLPLAL